MLTIEKTETSFSPLVVSVAHAIRQDSTYNAWPMLALADLLEQEGHRQELIDHCRIKDHEHVARCWVLNEILNTPWPIWKTIEIGKPELQTPEQFLKEFQKNNIQVSRWPCEMMENPEFSITPHSAKLDLVKTTVGDLGFSQNTRFDQILTRAEEMGLYECPVETGPQLRLQYPGKEWIPVVSKTLTDSDGGPGVFNLFCGGGDLWLGSGCGGPVLLWGPDDVLVFAPRKY